MRRSSFWAFGSPTRMYPLRLYLDQRFLKATFRNRDTQMGCSGLHRSLEGILRAALPPPPRLSLLLQLQLQLLPLPPRPCSEPDAALLLSSGSTGTLESPTPPSRRFHTMVFNRRIPSVSLLEPLLVGAAHSTVGVWVAPCLTIFLPHGRAAAPDAKKLTGGAKL